jgi:hypothetical protein
MTSNTCESAGNFLGTAGGMVVENGAIRFKLNVLTAENYSKGNAIRLELMIIQ